MDIAKVRALLTQALAELGTDTGAPPAAANTYRPVKGTPAKTIYQQWVAAGKPFKTADGDDVDNRGVPLNWSAPGQWISNTPKPQPGGDTDVPIEQG